VVPYATEDKIEDDLVQVITVNCESGTGSTFLRLFKLLLSPSGAVWNMAGNIALAVVPCVTEDDLVQISVMNCESDTESINTHFSHLTGSTIL
jgi:hypothetical protein